MARFKGGGQYRYCELLKQLFLMTIPSHKQWWKIIEHMEKIQWLWEFERNLSEFKEFNSDCHNKLMQHKPCNGWLLQGTSIIKDCWPSSIPVAGRKTIRRATAFWSSCFCMYPSSPWQPKGVEASPWAFALLKAVGILLLPVTAGSRHFLYSVPACIGLIGLHRSKQLTIPWFFWGIWLCLKAGNPQSPRLIHTLTQASRERYFKFIPLPCLTLVHSLILHNWGCPSMHTFWEASPTYFWTYFWIIHKLEDYHKIISWTRIILPWLELGGWVRDESRGAMNGEWMKWEWMERGRKGAITSCSLSVSGLPPYNASLVQVDWVQDIVHNSMANSMANPTLHLGLICSSGPCCHPPLAYLTTSLPFLNPCTRLTWSCRHLAFPLVYQAEVSLQNTLQHFWNNMSQWSACSTSAAIQLDWAVTHCIDVYTSMD